MTNFARSADGTNIAWYDFGGDGPDLLLGHATGFCAHVWAPVVELLKNDFRIFAYDLRGHGQSESPGRDRKRWDWQRYAEDVAAVLEASNLEGPVSVGHSCGAATALLLEESAPNSFAQLIGFEPVMFDAIPPTGPDEERDLAVRTRGRRTSFSSRDDAIANFSTRGPFTALHPDALAGYVDNGFETKPDGSVHLRCHPEDEAAVYVMASAHDGFVNLPSVKPPVTVVHGSESRSFEEKTMRRVAERMRNGQFRSMNGVGHFGALERPDEFVAIIKDVAGRR